MRAHYIQHVPFEGLGSIETWLKTAGCEITSTHLYASEALPQVEDIDLLIVMGGPMSVYDELEHPWLIDEAHFIRGVIRVGKPVLGICLGAQLIAKAMGGEVITHPCKEIGWYPVKSVRPSGENHFQFPEEVTAFHWHGESFTLPPEAELLAMSEACRNQAFQIGDNVLGLQFHLETTPDSAQSIVEHCRHELVEGQYIQPEQAILSASDERYDAINRLMGDILEYLAPPSDQGGE